MIFRSIKRCPRCNKIPKIRYGKIEPSRLYVWYYIKCCSFVEYGYTKKSCQDIWRIKIKHYKEKRKKMKFEILNENIKQEKQKVLFKLFELSNANIQLCFKKNSNTEWESLLTISQDGSIELQTSAFNQILADIYEKM